MIACMLLVKKLKKVSKFIRFDWVNLQNFILLQIFGCYGRYYTNDVLLMCEIYWPRLNDTTAATAGCNAFSRQRTDIVRLISKIYGHSIKIKHDFRS